MYCSTAVTCSSQTCTFVNSALRIIQCVHTPYSYMHGGGGTVYTVHPVRCKRAAQHRCMTRFSIKVLAGRDCTSVSDGMLDVGCWMGSWSGSGRKEQNSSVYRCIP